MIWRRPRARTTASDQALLSAREMEHQVRAVLASLREHLDELEAEVYSSQRDTDGIDV